ncbi:MAG TPA: response regulator transcription factor [Bryobacteraceae bacterium]|nr:response regulator transcription factor [Bryobacteraceae bacterium]
METATAPINLFLVDDHAMFRSGLARLFSREREFVVVGQSATTADALARLAPTATNMVLLDVDLGAERALDFVARARKQGFRGKILVLTAGITSKESVELVQSGVAGILHKHHTAEELCDTIRRVAAGEVYMEKEYLGALFKTIDKTQPPRRGKLTERDRMVLRFVFRGLTNREIGDNLKISESGAKSALRQLFDKLGVRTRSQLVKVALEQYADEL